MVAVCELDSIKEHLCHPIVTTGIQHSTAHCQIHFSLAIHYKVLTMSSTSTDLVSHDTLELQDHNQDESDCVSHSSDSDAGNTEVSTQEKPNLRHSQSTDSRDVHSPAGKNELTPTNYPSNQSPRLFTAATSARPLPPHESTPYPSNQNPAPTTRPLPTVNESAAILSEVCGRLSRETSREMVDLSNDPGPQQTLTQDLLPLYFYSWDLKSPIAVLVSLLLHCFVYQREIIDLCEGRRAFEDHIQHLKEKIASYEMKQKEMKLKSSFRPCTKSRQTEGCCDEVERLQNEMSTLRDENLRLQNSYDEVGQDTRHMFQ